MQYKLLSDESKYTLRKDVEKHLKNGWKLQGGVAMSMSAQEYCQAMVKD